MPTDGVFQDSHCDLPYLQRISAEDVLQSCQLPQVPEAIPDCSDLTVPVTPFIPPIPACVTVQTQVQTTTNPGTSSAQVTVHQRSDDPLSCVTLLSFKFNLPSEVTTTGGKDVYVHTYTSTSVGPPRLIVDTERSESDTEVDFYIQYQLQAPQDDILLQIRDVFGTRPQQMGAFYSARKASGKLAYTFGTSGDTAFQEFHLPQTDNVVAINLDEFGCQTHELKIPCWVRGRIVGKETGANPKDVAIIESCEGAIASASQLEPHYQFSAAASNSTASATDSWGRYLITASGAFTHTGTPLKVRALTRTVSTDIYNYQFARTFFIDAAGRFVSSSAESAEHKHKRECLPVTLTMSGGSAGSAMYSCSFLYTVTSIDGTALGSGVAPEMLRPLGATVAATHGICIFNSSDVLKLWWCDEIPLGTRYAIPVTLTTPTGFAGNASLSCAYTYTVISMDSVTLATGMSPSMQRPVGLTSPASHGLCTYNGSNSLALWWCDEVPDTVPRIC
jgi:hypothetical protein